MGFKKSSTSFSLNPECWVSSPIFPNLIFTATSPLKFQIGPFKNQLPSILPHHLRSTKNKNNNNNICFLKYKLIRQIIPISWYINCINYFGTCLLFFTRLIRENWAENTGLFDLTARPFGLNTRQFGLHVRLSSLHYIFGILYPEFSRTFAMLK